MDYTKASPEEACIQLLNVKEKSLPNLRRIFNRSWFYYSLKMAFGYAEEEQVIDVLKADDAWKLIDLFVADLSAPNFMIKERQGKLFELLKKARIPLITLSENDGFKSDYADPNWLHIQLPHKNIEHYIDAVNDEIANFWFELPSR